MVSLLGSLTPLQGLVVAGESSDISTPLGRCYPETLSDQTLTNRAVPLHRLLTSKALLIQFKVPTMGP